MLKMVIATRQKTITVAHRLLKVIPGKFIPFSSSGSLLFEAIDIYRMAAMQMIITRWVDAKIIFIFL